MNDYLKENKKMELKSKRAKARKNYYLDEEEDSLEAKLSECVEKCQKEAHTFLFFFVSSHHFVLCYSLIH